MGVSGLTSAIVEVSAYFLERLELDSESEKFMEEVNECTDAGQVCDIVCKYLDIISEHIPKG